MQTITTAELPTAGQILARLEQLAPLPAQGFLAGGAVANTILSLVDGKEYPVNDLDVFGHNHACTLEEVEDFDGGSVMEGLSIGGGEVKVLARDAYEPETMSMSKCYRVSKSYRVGMVNYIEIDDGGYGDKEQLTMADLLNAFDMNACQAGIDLATRELVLTEQFRLFLKNRQLRIWDVSTPYRSSIRLIKKQQELGAYCDLKGELSMLATAQATPSRYEEGEIDLDSIEVDGELKEKYLKVKDALADVIVGAPTVAPGYEEDLDIPFEVRELPASGSSLTLTFNKGLVRKEVHEFISGSTMGFSAAGYSAAFRRVWDGVARVQTQKSIKKAFAAVKGSHYVSIGACLYDNFLGTNVSPKKVSRIEKFMDGHIPALIQKFGRTLDEVYASVKVLESMGDHGMVAVGALENDTITLDAPLNREAAEAAVAAYIDSLGKDKLVEPLVLPNRLLRRGAKIKELITAADFIVEGARMHHCVAGYADSVKRGYYRIFHIELNGCHSTVQYVVQVGSDRGPSMVQHRGIRNASVSEAEAVVATALLKYIRLHLLLRHPLASAKGVYLHRCHYPMRHKYYRFKWQHLTPLQKKLKEAWGVAKDAASDLAAGFYVMLPFTSAGKPAVEAAVNKPAKKKIGATPRQVTKKVAEVSQEEDAFFDPSAEIPF